MDWILNSRQMFAAESAAVARGGSFLDLMERAGRACAQVILARTAPDKQVLVLAGKGKNGGDGYVIARELQRAGRDVAVLQVYGAPQAADAVTNFERAKEAGVRILPAPGVDGFAAALGSPDVLVDAIFGTGFRGAADAALTALIDAAKQTNAEVIAVDVPSGAESDTAACSGAVLRADLTIAIAAKKPIHILKPNCAVCGETVTVDIGILPEELRGAAELPCAVFSDDDLRALLPARPAVSNKGTFGHALCICGSRRMIGAAVLSVSAALRSGAGLVTAAFPDAAYPGIAPQLTESLLLPLPCNAEGTVCADAMDALLPAMKKASALLLGCGLGLNADTEAFVQAVLAEADCPVILDADGINAAAKHIDRLKKAKAPLVLTPHPGEMQRLTGLPIDAILADPVNIAASFAAEHSVTVLLKGANTVITDGRRAVINCTGNSGLAKGGSGDLLAGLLAGLCAQGMAPFDAACAAAYLHGKAADLVAAETSERGMLPRDVLAALPRLFSIYE